MAGCARIIVAERLEESLRHKGEGALLLWRGLKKREDAAAVFVPEPEEAPAPVLGGEATSISQEDDENPEAEYWQSDTISPEEDDATGAGGGGPLEWQL